MEARPTRRLLVRLLVGTIVPTVAALALFGFFAHELARRALEDELGRRLATAAAGAASMVLPEQLQALDDGDERSLTYANVRRRLESARGRLGVRRVLAVTPTSTRAATPRGRSRSGPAPTSWRPTAPRSPAPPVGRRPRRRCSSATTASPTSAPTRPSVIRRRSPASSSSRRPPTTRRPWRRSAARWCWRGSGRWRRCWR